MRVAIIGSGIAGLAAADALRDFDLTLYEAAPRVGGHVYTVELPGHPAVDMGFIVHNRERYPHFCALLDELGVATKPTRMAFSVSVGGREWGSASLSALFAERSSIASPRHWRFLLEALAFLRRARADLRDRSVGDTSLEAYCTPYSRELYERFVVPLAAALWSLAPDRCGAFPAITYLSFLDHHGMLSPIRPLAWRTIVGGSQRYVDALLAKLHVRANFALELATPVRAIIRDATGVSVDGTRYDRVVIATHADTALAMLGDPTTDERAALSAFRYSTNRTVLHTDRAFLPTKRAAHASWNYVADPDTSRVAVTYSMTQLQGLPDVPYLVTLNPRREPRGILHETSFTHPQFDRAALAAQHELTALQGTQRTYFAGAHFGFGFHEDGMRSGLAAAAKLRRDSHRELAA